jgi:hypothetical protein
MEAPIAVSQIGDNPYAPTRLNEVPLTDPAHFGSTEMTASLPVVDPH